MLELTQDISSVRPNTYNSNEIFRNRWSPRAMTGESISDENLNAMFEAAHWAPSAFNNQPWRFLYAKQGEQEWDTFFGLLVEANQAWCKNASALLVIVSKTTFDHNGKPMPTHAYDTGSAWGSFALEGAARGLVVHGMAGFEYGKVKEVLNIPDGFEVQAMAAVGVIAKPEVLPEQMQEFEKPSGRKDFKNIIVKGAFTDDLK